MAARKKPAMRAMWSRTVTFGLVSIPVGIYAAVEPSHRVSFRQLHKKDMAPIRYKKFCSAEDVEVPADEIVKGYEVEKGEYVQSREAAGDVVRTDGGVAPGAGCCYAVERDRRERDGPARGW